LVLIAAITGILGAAAVIYGIVTSLWASTAIGVLLLLVTLYTLVVLRGLLRRDHRGS
jgi:hypothetical protein